MAAKKSTAMLISEVEKEVASKLRDAYVKQAFNGTLKVSLESIYITRKEGKRALASLNELSMGARKG